MPTVFIVYYDGRCADYQIEQERAPIDLLLSLGYNGYRLLIGNSDDCIFTINKDIITLIEKSNFNFEKIK